jgi:hypothetical protein
MEPEGPFPCLQEHATESYLEPDESTHHPPTLFLCLIYLLTYLRSWALLEKLPIVQPLNSQEPSSGPHPEPDRSSPYHPILALCLQQIRHNIYVTNISGILVATTINHYNSLDLTWDNAKCSLPDLCLHTIHNQIATIYNFCSCRIITKRQRRIYIKWCPWQEFELRHL